MKVFIGGILLGALACACRYINNRLCLEDDNFFEETLEEQINELTGLDIDLSPDTPENKS